MLWAGAPSLLSPFTMDTVPVQSNKKALLFIALLVAAGLVGFGLGVALWEGGSPLLQDYSSTRLLLSQ